MSHLRTSLHSLQTLSKNPHNNLHLVSLPHSPHPLQSPQYKSPQPLLTLQRLHHKLHSVSSTSQQPLQTAPTTVNSLDCRLLTAVFEDDGGMKDITSWGILACYLEAKCARVRSMTSGYLRRSATCQCSNRLQHTFMAREHSQKPSANLNCGAVSRGQARRQQAIFSTGAWRGVPSAQDDSYAPMEELRNADRVF